MQEKKRIIIVGGGVSGLSAGIYAAQNGFSPLIIEKNPIVGGLCTGWYRKGYYLDGCMHWLTGTKENTELYKMWTNVGAFESRDDIIFLPSWGAFEYEGTTVTFWSDINKAEKEWLEISPKDKKHIKFFFRCVKKIMSLELPLEAPAKLLTSYRLLKLAKDFVVTFPHYEIVMRMSCETFANKFHHPALRWAISHAQPGDGNLYSMMFSYGTMCTGNGGIIKGGSLELANNMKKKYLYLGGELRLNTEVKSINIEQKNKKQIATGVTLSNGEVINADYVITCCDTNYALNDLLSKKFKIHNFLSY